MSNEEVLGWDEQGLPTGSWLRRTALSAADLALIVIAALEAVQYAGQVVSSTIHDLPFG